MIINGDAYTILKEMPSESVHMGVTSSPYYGLRCYDTPPQIWDGNPSCQHEWYTVHPPGHRSSDTNPGSLQHEGNKNRENLKSNVCIKCGAWRGELGQEATPEDFIRHLTIIYRELKRVLRSDGVFWANIGDSYWGGKGQSGVGNPEYQALRNQIGNSINGAHHQTGGNGKTRVLDGKHSSIKPKDLIGIPWMLAFSLRSDGAHSPQTMQVVERIRSSLLNDYDSWNEVPKSTKKTIEDLDEEWLKAQKGGWYLRADLPWIKRNSLPSSVTDRPSSSIEHVFLFSKSKKYFYDYVATMQPSSESYNKDKRPRGKLRQTVNENSKYPDEGQFKKQDGVVVDPINTNMLEEAGINFPPSVNGAIIFDSPQEVREKIRKQDGTGNPTTIGFNARYKASQEFNGKNIACDSNDAGRRMLLNIKTAREETGSHDGAFGHLRFMRDSDFFFKTWQGLMHNEEGEPMALVVNPRGYKGAHFACFPIQLIEPLILAGTSSRGVCPQCGAPWIRQTIKGEFHNQSWGGEHSKEIEAVGGVGENSCLKSGGTNDIITTGWKPSCGCINNIPIPALALDPFSGSSATGVACKLHNRRYIGIELNPKYCELGEQRLKDGK